MLSLTALSQSPWCRQILDILLLGGLIHRIVCFGSLHCLWLLWRRLLLCRRRLECGIRRCEDTCWAHELGTILPFTRHLTRKKSELAKSMGACEGVWVSRTTQYGAKKIGLGSLTTDIFRTSLAQAMQEKTSSEICETPIISL